MKLTNILLISVIPAVMLGCSVSVSSPEGSKEDTKVKPIEGGNVMPDYVEPATMCYGDSLTAIELTLEGNKARGFYARMNPPNGEMAGHGAYGSLNGTRSNRKVDMEHRFEVDGDFQIEDVTFVLHRDGTLSQGSGELVEKGYKLTFKDPSKITWGKPLEEISCSGNDMLEAARTVEKQRRAQVENM